MPLSDREHQILQEIERNLLADDPQMADVGRPERPGRDRIKLGVLGFFLGLVLLVLFFLTSTIVLGIASFIAMVGGLVLIAGGVNDTVRGKFRDLRTSERAAEFFSGWDKHFKSRGDGS